MEATVDLLGSAMIVGKEKTTEHRMRWAKRMLVHAKWNHLVVTCHKKMLVQNIEVVQWRPTQVQNLLDSDLVTEHLHLTKHLLFDFALELLVLLLLLANSTTFAFFPSAKK